MVRRFTVVAIVVGFAAPGLCQTASPARSSPFQRDAIAGRDSPQLPGADGLAERLVDGRFRLMIDDVVRLTLLNNNAARTRQLQHASTALGESQAYGAFQPRVRSSIGSNSIGYPATSTLEGALTPTSTAQQTQVGYSQLFQTGTRVDVNWGMGRAASNSTFSLYDTSFSSDLLITVGQPLLHAGGPFVQRAPILVAQRTTRRSRSEVEGFLTDLVARAIDQYLGVMRARETLAVVKRSLEAAEATYAQNKRALELGALPPLEIYRSQSQVAARRMQMIQAEYAVRDVEDNLRHTIGADLSEDYRVRDLDLIETVPVEPVAAAIDVGPMFDEAISRRPELAAVHMDLDNDQTAVTLARYALEPELTLSGFYGASGRSGDRVDATVLAPVLSRGGLGEALAQVGRFNFPTYGFRVTLDMPVLNRAGQSHLAQTLLAREQNLYRLRELEQQIRLDVLQAARAVERAGLELAASRVTLELARQNLDAEQRKYELGAETIFFVLDAQTQLGQAELAVLQAQIDYRRAAVQVDRAKGTLLDRYHVVVSDSGF